MTRDTATDDAALVRSVFDNAIAVHQRMREAEQAPIVEAAE